MNADDRNRVRGAIRKSETRRESYRLPQARPRGGGGICFIGSITRCYADEIEEHSSEYPLPNENYCWVTKASGNLESPTVDGDLVLAYIGASTYHIKGDMVLVTSLDKSYDGCEYWIIDKIKLDLRVPLALGATTGVPDLEAAQYQDLPDAMDCRGDPV